MQYKNVIIKNCTVMKCINKPNFHFHIIIKIRLLYITSKIIFFQGSKVIQLRREDEV
jgi:hypothetical protein